MTSRVLAFVKKAQAAAADPKPVIASASDIEAAKRHRDLASRNPLAAAALLNDAATAQSIIRGREALRGERATEADVASAEKYRALKQTEPLAALMLLLDDTAGVSIVRGGGTDDSGPEAA